MRWFSPEVVQKKEEIRMAKVAALKQSTPPRLGTATFLLTGTAPMHFQNWGAIQANRRTFCPTCEISVKERPSWCSRPFTWREFLTVKAVAARLGVVKDTVYRLIRAGELTSLRVGRSVRIRWTDVEAYLKKKQ